MNLTNTYEPAMPCSGGNCCTPQQGDKLRTLGLVPQGSTKDGCLYLEELLYLLPNQVAFKPYGNKSHLEIAKEIEATGWCIQYRQYSVFAEGYEVSAETVSENLAQAAAHMLIYLLENKYMTL